MTKTGGWSKSRGGKFGPGVEGLLEKTSLAGTQPSYGIGVTHDLLETAMKAQYGGHRILWIGEEVLVVEGTPDSLHEWTPNDPTDFSVTIDFYAGSVGGRGMDAFELRICSPIWFFRAQTKNIVSGENTLFVIRYDSKEIEAHIAARVAQTEGESWDAIGAQLTRFGGWEFDYRAGSHLH